MNKYIDRVTVKEYKTILQELKNNLQEYEKSWNNKTMTEKEKANFIELKFITRKIEKIIKEYEKEV